MIRTFNTRYAVKSSSRKYAKIICLHRTLGEAYKTVVRHHREHYKNHKFIFAQPVIPIIVTEASEEVIRKDIKFWRTLDFGPRSHSRLPLPIVVHQWNPNFEVYQEFGETE